MEKRLNLDIVIEVIEDAFLPLPCTVEKRFIDKKKYLIFHVFAGSGLCLLTDICSIKFINEFHITIRKSRKYLKNKTGVSFILGSGPIRILEVWITS
ncbi:MAG: hypothetical protein PHF56_17235 [Desulfuromonadaceae bacterium]|nr:hypothetical protein [Desulfuromonadaceae bacterium]